MRILTIHNRYRYRGGEDESREAEDKLLAARGHEVRQVIFDNTQINLRNALRVGIQATWSHSSYTRVLDYISSWRPDILDVHNFFPLASPAIYYAAQKLKIPVVQTLHNYRILCPAATFYRKGQICEDCTRHLLPWPGVLHRCYRGSALQTSAVALMIAAHRFVGTWEKTVSLYFVLSEFEKKKFVENGFPEKRIMVKPNFVAEPGGTGCGGGPFLFVGRLSPEKGISTLLRAIASSRSPEAKFQIVGEGPLEDLVLQAASEDPRIDYLGKLPLHRVMRMMGNARAVLVTSEWYEPFGRVASEAFAVGTPVICTGLGALGEIVEDGVTGFHYNAFDPEGLAAILDRTSAEPDLLTAMRAAARSEYEEKYTAERNYELLVKGYGRAIDIP